MFGIRLTIEEQIQKQQEEVSKAQRRLDFLIAEKFLCELWDNATYSCLSLISYDPDYANPKKLFTSLGISYYAENSKLLKKVQQGAKHFKDMDDSQDWPSWKKEAYKQAKIYQEYYNNNDRYNR